ncbi:MAG: LexA family transcriptional regulator [Elusimicrobiaceae bacterium]|nr:LexA family transcriptional regulator [Elusimicrobiaceae bacterium]
MNKFEKALASWNDGTLRGAQAKLAKILKVSTATVALWATGKRNPSKGYVAQMAKLFGMSEEKVLRLFMPTTYPENSSHTAAFHENTNDGIYNADKETELVSPQSNSVALPFLANVPAGYPDFDEADVIEWWTLPRRYAKGAKYLVRCCGDSMQGSVEYDDLCLIKPETNFLDGKIMLVKVENGYLIKRICKENGKIVLYSDNNKKYKAFAPDRVQPIGLVVRKITDVQ